MAARELAQARLNAEIQDRRTIMALGSDMRTYILSTISSVPYFRQYEQDLDGTNDEDEGEDVAPDKIRPTLTTIPEENA